MRPIEAMDVRADDLRYLLAIARNGRMVTAANELGVDHTTVARRIRTLERALGHRLLDRGAQGWELTSVGRAVVDTAAPIEDAVNRIVELIPQDTPERLRGTVRISAPDGLGVFLVVPTIQAMHERHPGIRIELFAAPTVGIRSDIAIATGSSGGQRWLSEPLAGYELRLYASTAYLESHVTIDSFESLRRHPLVFSPDTIRQLDQLDLARHLAAMPTAFSSVNPLAQLAATRASAGVGLLPAYLAESAGDLIPVLPDRVDIPQSYELSVVRENADLPSVRAVRSALVREARVRFPDQAQRTVQQETA